MKSQTEIFKIQQDFSGSLCLIYNEDRSVMGQFPLDKRMKKLLDGALKTYVWGRYNDKTTKIDIDRECTGDEMDNIFW